MFKSNLDKIREQKEKAFRIFTQTRDDLKGAITSAFEVITENERKAGELQNESMLIKGHIDEMHTSLEQINKILGN